MGNKAKHRKINKNQSQRTDELSKISVTRGTLIVAASLGLTLFFYMLFARIPSLIGVVSKATASATSGVLSILGLEVSLRGTILELSGFSFELVPDCTPLPPILLLSGAILAFPATWRAKGIGIIAGALILSALNLLRTVSLVYIEIYMSQWLDIAHNVIWQSVMIIAGVLVWLFWCKSYARELHA